MLPGINFTLYWKFTKLKKIFLCREIFRCRVHHNFHRFHSYSEGQLGSFVYLCISSERDYRCGRDCSLHSSCMSDLFLFTGSDSHLFPHGITIPCTYALFNLVKNR